MKSNQKTVQRIKAFLANRVVAVSALVAAVAVMMGYVTMNLRTVTINDGNVNHSIVSMTTDSGLILKAAGLTVDEDDVVTAEWEFSKGEINVTRAVDVTVSVDGVTRTITLTEGTVADALKKAGVTLGKDDVLNVAADTKVADDMKITVDRVTYKERKETAVVPYGSTSYETDDYNVGETVVETAGVNGEKTKVFRDRYVNGELAESVLASETVTVAPVDEVIAVGTYVKPAAPVLGNAGATADFTYSAVYYGNATAYTNDQGLAGEWTASGLPAQVGVVAVDPDVIPYGTRLYITTEDGSYVYGYCIAGDTGSFIYDGTGTIVDLFFNTVGECYEFGRRSVIVYVLD